MRMQQKNRPRSLRISLGGTGNMKQYMSVREKLQKEKEEKKREIFIGRSDKFRKQSSR